MQCAVKRIDKEWNKPVRNWVKMAYLNICHYNKLITRYPTSYNKFESTSKENILTSAKRLKEYF